MASGQRAFAQKLNKQGAAEVRKQVSSAYIQHGSFKEMPKSISGGSLSSNVSIPLSEVVEPLDFEEVMQCQQGSIDRDPMRHLLEFPHDDVEVNLLPRKCRTIAPVVPEHGSDSDPHIRDCVNVYTSDYHVVHRRYQGYSSSVNAKTRSIEVIDSHKALPQQEFEIDVEETPDQEELDKNKRTSIHMNDTPRGSWASSIFDLKNSQADALLPNILEHRHPDEIDRNNEFQRRQERHDAVFTLYPLQHEDDFLEKRSSENPPCEHFGHRILVKCLQLKLELDVEPIFASMALYDAKERKKISENFYFDLVPEDTKKMLTVHIPYQDISTLSRSCIFSITYPSSDVFLVVKLEKVLQQGDIAECAEPYMKDEKSVNKDKVKANAAYFCEKLGQYRMPFAWTAIYLMNIVSGSNSMDSTAGAETASNSGSIDRRSSFVGQFDSFRRKQRDDSLQRRESMERQKSGTFDKRTSWSPEESTNLDNFRPVTLTVSSFFKQEADRLSDEDLYKFLADLKRPTNILKKLKCIPGTLKLDISPSPEEPKYCLSPELYKIDPYPDDKGRPTKEVLEFPPREVYVPYSNYRNLLYVYPKSLNFTNRQGHARNIAVKIEILQGESETDALPVIFGKSSCPEFQSHAFTTVTYHSKSPDFHEEVKMRLPAKIGDQYHLLFTFYHISCQKKQDLTGPLETPIGYTWLPLLKDGRLLAGEFSLPVSLEPPPSSYSMIMPDVLVPLPGMKWVDNHKSLFTVSVEAASSIHTQDEYLDKFFTLCHMAEEQQIPARIGEANFESQLKVSITNVAHASAERLVRFLTLVLDKLICLMVRPPILGGQVVNMAQSAFDSISQIARTLQTLLKQHNDIHDRNSLLVQYVQYSCTLPYPEGSSVHKSPSGPLSGYSTLGRPTSLQVTRPYHARSSSDPDLPGSNPTSPVHEYPGQAAGSRISTVERPVCPRQPADMQTYYQKVKKLVHEQIALQWVVSSGSTRETALTNAWFFFELMIKSMADHLARTGKFFGSRKVRFPPHFLEDVTELVDKIIRDIVDRYTKDVHFIRSVNTSLAFFLYDAISLMDRGYVFNLIKNYCRMVSAKISALPDATSLTLLKLDFMRIVCSHEHFVALNLPFGTPTTPSASVSPSPSVCSNASYASNSTLVEKSTFAELTTEFRQQHFLVGLVLSDLVNALESHNTNVHSRAINVTRNLLFCHDTDARFVEPEIKARVAALYLPVIIIVIDALPQLNDPYTEAREMAGDMSPTTERHSHEIDESVAMAIAASSVYSSQSASEPEHYDAAPKGRKCVLTGESSRNLLMSFLWVLKNISRRTLRQLWSEMSMSRLNQVLDVLLNCISNFEYKGRKSRQMSQQIIKKSSDMKSKLEEAILGSGSARSEMMSRRRGGSSAQFYIETGPPSPAEAVGRLRWRKDQTQWKQEHKGLPQEGRSVLEPQVDYHVEGNLSTEVAMTVLDMLELITQIVSSSDSMQSLLSSIMRVLLHMMSVNQSTVVLRSVFATQRSIVSKFPELLFEEDTEQCADLCLRLLRHCSSSMSAIRTQAGASLYLLMRQNYEKGNNFARVKMQVTMSLSSLVGQSHTFNEEFLRKSLKTILTYAEADVELQETTFPSQVKDLVFNLHMILSDTVKMKEFQEDPEMLLDLMYRIAKGYQNSPDLRLTWLQNMAQKHTEKGNNAEAALCLVHSAGLVAEYLNMLEDRPHLPVGCVTFQKVSFNVLEESAVSDDVVSPDEEGICTGKFFTEGGLVGLLEQAAASFNTAGLFEAVNEVYKILLPIHEYNRDFKKLAIIHGKLQDAFNNVIKQEGKRIFGTYFRVGFYGSKFGDLDGEEYIYKEQSITKLSEISHRLEGFYGDRFGHEHIDMIKDSNTVERDKLNPEKAYIQITYVEPYFDGYELRERFTYFDKNYNLKRFMYATPFTTDGRAHGELQDQYKRKTILSTERSFPYVKTRISVIKREQVILSPIEVAIEDVQKKTRELAFALSQEPPDPKMLQMVLQGCIGTTVNQGPLEVAQVFLLDVAEGRAPPTKHHNKLRLCFKDFLKKCGDALHRNKSLIHADQREYQRELDKNYHAHREKLTPLITNNAATLRRPKHKKYRREGGSKKKQPSVNQRESVA